MSGFMNYDGMALNELITEMAQLKRRLDDVSAEKSLIQKQYDVLRTQYVPEAMVGDEVTNIALEGVGRVHLTGDLFISIKSAKRQQAYEWLIEQGFGDLIVDTVNAGTLKAAAKGWLEKGEVEIPDDLFNVNPITRAVLTKVK